VAWALGAREIVAWAGREINCGVGRRREINCGVGRRREKMWRGVGRRHEELWRGPGAKEIVMWALGAKNCGVGLRRKKSWRGVHKTKLAYFPYINLHDRNAQIKNALGPYLPTTRYTPTNLSVLRYPGF
jgi:hypothetical protein